MESNELFRKQKLIIDFKKDDLVHDIFVVKFKKPVEPYRNGFKFELRLGDSSKEIMYKYWGSNDEEKVRYLYDSIKKGDVVFIQGRVNEWNDAFEISANSDNNIHVLKKGEYNPRDFIKVSDRNIEDLFKQLKGYYDKIKNISCREVLNYFFSDINFVNKFKEWPAAMYIHHGWVGGLLEHTLNVVVICKEMYNLYPELDYDILITGAILHDIGKLKEFEMGTSIDMSEEGMLIGHVNLGLEMLDHCFECAVVNKTLKIKLKHIILTHMGEYGSYKKPSFPEALIIHLADKMDADVNCMLDLKKNSNTEDDYLYTKRYGNIYLK